MHNKIFSNNGLDYIKSKKENYGRKKVEEQWNALTKKRPIAEYKKKLDTVLRKKKDERKKDFELQINITQLTKNSQAILEEIKKQNSILKNVTETLEILEKIAETLKKIAERIVIQKTPLLNQIMKKNDSYKSEIKKASIVKIENIYSGKGLGEHTSKKLYNRLNILRKDSTWRSIANLLNSKRVPTLSGSGKWSPELLRYFMKKIEGNKFNSSKKNSVSNIEDKGENINVKSKNFKKNTNRNQLYKIMFEMRSNDVNWFNIAVYLDTQGIPTLSGKSNWTKDNARLAFQSLRLKSTKTQIKHVVNQKRLNVNLPKNNMNRRKLYKLMLKIRTKNIIWSDIAEYFNKEEISTLSGKKVWTRDNVRVTFKRLSKENIE